MINTSDHQRHWDDKYSQGNTHADYQPDTDLVNCIWQVKSTGLALDVACGTGRNSFFVAQHGLDVVCMDFSAKGLSYLKQNAVDDALSKKLFPIQADLTKTPLPVSIFNFVMVVRYLDRNAFTSYIDALKPGGLLFFKAFNINHLNRKPGFNPDYLLQPNELINQFKGFEIMQSNDSKSITDYESVILVRK